MRILVIEDDYISRSVMARLLAPFGTVDLAEDGHRGLELCRHAIAALAHYELITLDIMMPGIDGLATLMALRELEKQHALGAQQRARVLMTSALDDVRSITTAFRELCDDYIVKPVRKSTLYEKIVELGFQLPVA